MRASLQEHAHHALADHRQAFSSQVWRWAEEQTSIALHDGLAYTEVHKAKRERQRYQNRVKVRLSSLGVEVKNGQNVEVLFADDGALEWLREYSSEWVKLACDDPHDGLSLFFGWRAPAWACDSEGDSIGDRATEEQTNNLLNHAAAALRTELENARYDAFKLASTQASPRPGASRLGDVASVPMPMPGPRVPKKGRRELTPRNKIIREILRQHPKLTTKELCEVLHRRFENNPRHFPMLDKPTFGGETFSSWKDVYDIPKAQRLLHQLASRLRHPK